MKSVTGFLLEAIGAVLFVASIVAAGPAFGSVIQGSEKSVSMILEVIFLALAGAVGFALGLFMHKIEALAGD
jgi:membrane protein DedA with SNARE-associated domain